MVALTLAAWRDRMLEQGHFAATAAMHTVVVHGHPRLRQCVAAPATGALTQCLAQRANIDAVRHRAHGMAVRGTAAPGCATTPDPQGALRLKPLAEALHRLGGEHARCHLRQPQHVRQPHAVNQHNAWRLLFFVRLALARLRAGSQAAAGAGLPFVASGSTQHMPLIARPRGQTAQCCGEARITAQRHARCASTHPEARRW